MGDFKKVDFANTSKGRVDFTENEISVVVTGTKTPNYILMNNYVKDEVFGKGFSKLNVFCDQENKVVAFQFGKTGDIAVRQGDGEKKKPTWRISNKTLVGYIMDFFDVLPGDNGHHKLHISQNKAQGKTDYVMYYIRKSGMEQVNFK